MRRGDWFLALLLVAILAHRESGCGLSIDGVQPGMTADQVRSVAGDPVQEMPTCAEIWTMASGAVVGFEGTVSGVTGCGLMEDGNLVSDPRQAGFIEEYGLVGCTDHGCYQMLTYRRGFVSIPAVRHQGVTTYTLGSSPWRR